MDMPLIQQISGRYIREEAVFVDIYNNWLPRIVIVVALVFQLYWYVNSPYTGWKNYIVSSIIGFVLGFVVRHSLSFITRRCYIRFIVRPRIMQLLDAGGGFIVHNLREFYMFNPLLLNPLPPRDLREDIPFDPPVPLLPNEQLAVDVADNMTEVVSWDQEYVSEDTWYQGEVDEVLPQAGNYNYYDEYATIVAHAEYSDGTFTNDQDLDGFDFNDNLSYYDSELLSDIPSLDGSEFDLAFDDDVEDYHDYVMDDLDLQDGVDWGDEYYLDLLFDEQEIYSTYCFETLYDGVVYPQMETILSEKNARRKHFRDKATKRKKVVAQIQGHEKKTKLALIYQAIAFIDRKCKHNKACKKLKSKSKEEYVDHFVDLQDGDCDFQENETKSPVQHLRDVISDRFIDSQRADAVYVVAAVEEVILLLTSLSMCNSTTHMVVVACQFLSSKLDKGILVTVSDLCKQLLLDDGLSLQAGDVEELKSAKTIWEIIKTSKFTSKMVKLISLMISVVMCKAGGLTFTMSGFTKYFSMASKHIKTGESVISYVFDFTIFFIEKAIGFFSSGDVMSLFYDDNLAAEYQDEYSFLISKTIAVEAGLLHTLGITFHEFTYRLIQCQELTKKYLFECKTESDRNVYGAKLTVLRKLHESLKVAYQVMPSRIKPLGIYLFGDSGVGKSNLRNILAHSIATHNPDYFAKGPDYVVSYNAGDKYMSEIKAFHQILIMDDIGNATVQFMDVNHTQVIIAILNNEPRAVIKAAVEEKGAIYMNFNLVIGTGNKDHMNADTLSVEPVSILRRFELHIEVFVRDEYKQDLGRGIDSSKTTSLLDDVWLFEVTRVYKNADGNAGREHLSWQGKKMSGINLDTLLKFTSDYSKNHYVRQTGLLMEQNNVFELAPCPHGSLIGVCTECVEPQDGDDDEWYYTKYKESCNSKMNTACLSLAKYYDTVALYSISSRMNKVPFIGKIIRASSVVAAWVSFGLWLTATSCFPSYIILNFVVCSMIYPILSVLYALISFEQNVRRAAKVSHLAVQKANKFVTRNKAIIAIAAGCGVLYVLRNMYRVHTMSNLDLQGGVVSHTPEDKVDNVWLKPEVVPPPVDLRCRTMTLEQVLELVKSEIAYARFDGRKVCNMFPIKANVYLVNWHILTYGFTEVEVIKHDPNMIGRNFKQKFDKTSYVRVGVTDFALLYLSRGGTQKDMLHLFPHSHTKRPVAATFVHKNKDAVVYTDSFNASPKMYEFNHPSLDLYGRCYALEYHMHENTRDGLCMGALISMGKVPYIAGFHSAGKKDTPYGVAQQITQVELEGAMVELYENKRNTPFETTSQNGFEGVEVEGKLLTGEIHDKSAMRFQESGHAIFYGSHTGPRAKGHSKVCPTKICNDVEEVFHVKNMFGKPAYINHWKPENAEAKAMLNTCQLDPEIMRLAHIDLADHVTIQLNNLEHCKNKVGLISNVHNASGVDKVKFLDRINLKASTGWPHNKPKKDLVEEYLGMVGDVTDPITFPDEVWDEVDDAAKKMAEGSRVNFVNQACKKDEPKKLGSEKVRIFYSTPLVLLLLMRRYTLTISKFVMDHWYMFETTLGINVASRDWEKFLDIIRKHGDSNIVAGDFEKFDTLMSTDTILYCFKILILIAEWSGNYDEYDIAVLRGIATEISQPMLEFFGDMLMTAGNHISGHSLTIIINGWANCHKMRYTYYDVFDKNPPGPFHRYVSLMTNGDDNCMGVSSYIPQYNHTTIAASLRKVGINYTMADKLSESRPYINLSEVSYLKRTPVFFEKYGHYMAQLEKASIFKMLMNYIPSAELNADESSAEVLNGALREIFMYGEEEFADWREKLSYIADKRNLKVHMKDNDLVTYEACERAYISQY